MGIQSNLFAWCIVSFLPRFYFFWASRYPSMNEHPFVRIEYGEGDHKTLQITIYRQQRLDHYHTKSTVTIRDLLIRVRTRSTGNELQGPNLSEYPGMWLKAVMKSTGTFTLGQNFKMEPPRHSALFTKQRRSVLGTFLTDILIAYHRLNATHFSETWLSSRMWR
jgi:hypothetical protein